MILLTDSKVAENLTSMNLEGWGDLAQRLNLSPDATEIGTQSDQVPVGRQLGYIERQKTELQHLSDVWLTRIGRQRRTYHFQYCFHFLDLIFEAGDIPRS